MVQPNDLGVSHASSPDVFPQGPWQEGNVDQKGLYPLSLSAAVTCLS